MTVDGRNSDRGSPLVVGLVDQLVQRRIVEQPAETRHSVARDHWTLTLEELRVEERED